MSGVLEPLPSKTSATAHRHFSCETFTAMSSVIVQVSCLHGCAGDTLMHTDWFTALIAELQRCVAMSNGVFNSLE